MSLHTVFNGSAVKSYVVSAVNAVRLGKVQGYVQQASTGSLYLQIHEAASLPSNGAVPAYVRVMNANFDFSYDLALQKFQPCVLALSTTEATLTIAVNAGDKATFVLEIEDYEPEITGLSTATNAVLEPDSQLTVLADTEANAAKRLYKVEVTPGAGVDWLMLFTGSTVTSGDVPHMQWTVTSEVANILHFGTAGLAGVQEKVAGVLQNGVYLALSTTPSVYTPHASATSAVTAYYK